MNSLLVATNAVVPFLIYLGFGAVIVRAGWAEEGLLRQINKLSFRAFFPFLMFSSIYRIDGDFAVNWAFVGLALALVLVVVAVSMVVVPRIIDSNQRRGVVVQAIYRTNLVFFAFPLATSVFGDEALLPAAAILAFVVSAYNVIAVLVLEFFHHEGISGVSPGRLLLDVAMNPIIQGLAVGLIFKLLGIAVPDSVAGPVKAIGDLATPIALIVLGGTLHLAEVRANLPVLAPTLLVKLVVLPALALGVTSLFGLTAVEQFLIIMMFAAPVATASYPMAESMGGDGALAGQFVVLSTVVSIPTLFCWVTLLSALAA